MEQRLKTTKKTEAINGVLSKSNAKHNKWVQYIIVCGFWNNKTNNL